VKFTNVNWRVAEGLTRVGVGAMAGIGGGTNTDPPETPK
jgi:hypothetical protein